MLAHSYPPSNHSGAQRPFRFAKFLGRQGRRVEVLTSTEFSDGPNEAGVHRFPQAPKTSFGGMFRKLAWKLGLPFRAYDYGFMWIVDSPSYATALVRKLGPCVVISTFPPLSTHLTALWLKNYSSVRKSVKWIADFRDPMVGNPFRPGNRLASMLDRRLETAIVRGADAILVNTDVLAKDLTQRHPSCAQKIKILWNGYDPDEEFGPLPIPARPHRVLAHVGTMYGGRHPAMLLDSMDRLRQQGLDCLNNLKLVQIGSVAMEMMPNRERFERLVREGKIELSGERLPRPVAMRAIAEADLLLLIDLNTGDESTQVPAKIFDYVRAGRPILLFTNRNSPSAGIVQGCGIPQRIVYRDDSPDQVDTKVREFLALPSDPATPSELFREHFNGAHQALELADLIGRL